MEYDEEEIGDLEEQGQHIRGFADVAGEAGGRRRFKSQPAFLLESPTPLTRICCFLPTPCRV